MFALTLLLLIGSSFATWEMNPDLWEQRIKAGLIKVATGQKTNTYLNQTDAARILFEWYNVTVKCTEPTEKMWLGYCQQFYIAEKGDCSAASPETKAQIMRNMRICRVVGRYG